MKQVREGQILCDLTCTHVWLLSASVVSDSATLWTVACQLPLSIRFFSTLEWVDLSSSRGSSQPEDQTHISCFGRQIPYHWATWEAPLTHISGQWESRQGWPGSSWETSWKGIVYVETFLSLRDSVVCVRCVEPLQPVWDWWDAQLNRIDQSVLPYYTVVNTHISLESPVFLFLNLK